MSDNSPSPHLYSPCSTSLREAWTACVEQMIAVSTNHSAIRDLTHDWDWMRAVWAKEAPLPSETRISFYWGFRDSGTHIGRADLVASVERVWPRKAAWYLVQVTEKEFKVIPLTSGDVAKVVNQARLSSKMSEQVPLYYLVYDEGFVLADEWTKDQIGPKDYSPLILGTYKIISQHDPTRMRSHESIIESIREMLAACNRIERPEPGYEESEDLEELLAIYEEVAQDIEDYGFMADVDGEMNTWTLYEEIR